MKWISVKDNMPAEERFVLVTVKPMHQRQKQTTFLKWSGVYWLDTTGDYSIWTNEEVTHWSNFPDPCED